MSEDAASGLKIGYLGPRGTFTEEALLTQPDFRAATLVELPGLADTLQAVTDGVVDLGFLPIENAIEGTIRDTVDSLAFEQDLLIQREVVLDIHLHLMAPAGTRLEDVTRVASIPVATAQCRRYLAGTLPGAELVATSSTAEAARMIGAADASSVPGGPPGTEPGVTAAIAPRLAADLYGLSVLAEDVEDHAGNQTRFVAVAASGIPAPTGSDKTTVVCFQRENRPGSLHGIIGEFAARNIDLSKVESRPAKTGLGDYCFIFDLEGHIADEIVADCLRVLHAELADVKFLGSYPTAGHRASAVRQEASVAWREADAWMEGLRSQIGNGPAVP